MSRPKGKVRELEIDNKLRDRREVVIMNNLSNGLIKAVHLDENSPRDAVCEIFNSNL